MEFVEDVAIRLAQEVVNGEVAHEQLMEHLNAKFLPSELATLAKAAQVLAVSAERAEGTDELP